MSSTLLVFYQLKSVVLQFDLCLRCTINMKHLQARTNQFVHTLVGFIRKLVIKINVVVITIIIIMS